MKTYEEMAQNALKRISDYKEKQKKRRKAALKIAVPAASFCVIAAVCIGAWKLNLQKVKAPISDISEEKSGNHQSSDKTDSADKDGNGENYQSPDKAESADRSGQETAKKGDRLTVEEPATEEALCFLFWKNKLVMSGELYHALENDPDGDFCIYAEYRPTTANITSFSYEGKTLAEWAIAAENEKLLPEKMAELLKLGDELKYGTALYETGTPDGIKWDRSFYEQEVAYFGDLLKKYIVNGRFLKEQLEEDIAALSPINVSTPDGKTTEYIGEASKKYKQAFNAYLETVMPEAIKQLAKSGIHSERDDARKTNRLTLIVTAEQLENLQLDDLKNWRFSLVSENQKGASDEETATENAKICY